MKTKLLFILLLTLFGCGGNAMPKKSSVPVVNIDPQVFLKLSSIKTVSVMIQLKLPATNNEPKEVEIFKVQEKVLKKLPANEFKLYRRYTSISGLSGEISEKGINILKYNPDILRISLTQSHNLM